MVKLVFFLKKVKLEFSKSYKSAGSCKAQFSWIYRYIFKESKIEYIFVSVMLIKNKTASAILTLILDHNKILQIAQINNGSEI